MTGRQIRRIATRALAEVDPAATLGRLFGHGENSVYAVADRPWVLRVHRVDYHTDAALRSEHVVLDALPAHVHRGRPVRARDGRTLLHVDGRRVSVLTRVDGRIAGQPSARRCAILGATLRALHHWSHTWHPPAGFERPRWDREGLYGSDAPWGVLEDAGIDPGLAADLRAWLDERLAPLGDEVCLLHHDLHRGNVIWRGDRPGLIDWDDCGFGYPLTDLWIAASRHPEACREALFDGYGGLPPAWRAVLPAMDLALRARIVPWLRSRADIPAVAARLPELRSDLVRRARAALTT